MQNTKYYILNTIPVFLLTFLLFLHPIIDLSQDLGRHIKLGEIIIQTHQIPTINLFSYTYPNFPFINHHWLSEVIFYLLNLDFGTFGLLLIMALFPAAGITLLFYFVSKRTNLVVAFVSTCIYLNLLISRTYLRPELFSDFFVAVFVVILYKNREKPTRWLFLLPILEILWANMHIYFVIGPLLVLIFLIDTIFSHITDKQTKFSVSNFHPKGTSYKIAAHFSKIGQILNTKYQILLLVFVLTAFAPLLNPNFLTGALYPLHVLSNYGYSIEENQSLYFLINYGIWPIWYTIFFAVCIILFGLLFIYRKHASLAGWLLSIIFTIAAFQAERNITLFVFATLIPFTILLSKIPFSFPKYHTPRALPSSKRRILNTKYLACIASAGMLIFLSIHTNGFGLTIQPSAERGVDFFIQNNLKGPILNNFDIGSYLDYRLYPKERVFVDGRPEAYPVGFFQKTYIPMQQDPKTFEQVDQKYHFQSIFFSYTDQTPWAKQFIVSIMQNPKWQLVYLDTFSAIWVKKDGINKSIPFISQITPSNFSLPNDQRLTTIDYFHLVYFFSLVGWNQNITAVLNKILTLDPSNCTALGILVQNPATTSIYQSLYQANCH